jgi:2-phosphosulfolactate phosphatase
MTAKVQRFEEVSRYAAPAQNRLHVLYRKEELDHVRLPQKVVVVLDILFATTTIVAALAAGATEVIPAFDEQDARQKASALEADSYLLAGEKNIYAIPGFATPLPLALQKENLPGRRVIYSTTNGTVALRLAERAPHVYAACLLNGAAVAAHIRREHPDDTVLIVCSGSGGGVNLEDLYGAGYMVDQFAASLDEKRDLSDAALVARKLYQGSDGYECLIGSRVGRIMQSSGLEEEVRFAAREDHYRVVAKLQDGVVQLLEIS